MNCRDHRRCAGIGITVVLVTLLGVVLGTSAEAAYRPHLAVEASVAADLGLLAVQTWDRFVEAFWARKDCIGDVSLRASYSLRSRASYDPIHAVVTVRVPGTPAMLEGALVHEWAHHVEFQCAEHALLRQAFLAAQGLPPGTAWRPHDHPAEIPAGMWAEIPSEQCAEAAIAYVLGSREIPTHARFSQEAIAVVALWATGKDPKGLEGAQLDD